MNILPIKQGALDYLVIDNVYTDEELEAIYKELITLLPHAQGPNKNTAAYADGTSKRQGSTSIFLDEYYGANRNASSIMTLNRKLFCNDILHKAVKLNAFYEHIGKSTYDNTLINYYSNGGGYDTHNDYAVVTAVTTFQIGNVSGGDFIFPDYEQVVKFKPNRTVIFPSCVDHKADNIVADEGSYRISMVQFISYREIKMIEPIYKAPEGAKHD